MQAKRSADLMSGAAAGALANSPALPAMGAQLEAGPAGDATSRAALDRLRGSVADLRAAAVGPLLQQAVAALNEEDHKAGADWAMKALALDERSGLAWYLLAIAREKASDFKSALQCYESALQLLPDETHVANDLGRLAYRMGMKETAAKLFQHFLNANPGSAEAANNMACALRDLGRAADAIEILRPAIMAHPTDPLLWNSLGSVMSEQGDCLTALTFYDEALRLDAGFYRARYNRGNTLLSLGDLDGAMAECERAMGEKMPAAEAAMMRLARSTIRLCSGDLGGGWDDYEVRLDPDFADVTHFMIDRPRWTPESELAGKSILVMGEQGLGDEVMFANVIPDLLRALGPDGKLALAVEPRLVPLMQRSFPTAWVGPHATYSVDGHLVRGAPFAAHDFETFDLWTPLASLLRRFRRQRAHWPTTVGYLNADPVRVAHWRKVLEEAPAGPKIGLLWKSMRMDGLRRRSFSAFGQWEPVLKTPGLSFINMQYGDCTDEIAYAREELGVTVWQPPGIDLKQDLDDVAALSCALDLTLGSSNATTNIAAACGAPVWMISTPDAWSRCGEVGTPWYPQARVFTPSSYGQWDPVMADVAQALAETF